MDQEGHAPTGKRRKISQHFTEYSIVQSVDDSTVDKSVCSRSLMVDLTGDAWLLVFDYLDIVDKTRIAGVCRRWRDLAQISWKCTSRLSFENCDVFKSSSDQLLSGEVDEPGRVLEVLLRQYGKFLKCLDLSSAFHYLCSLTSKLDLVSCYCTSLQELHLSHVFITPEGLKTLAEKLPRLRSLSLKDCLDLDSESYMRLVLKSLQSLKSLNVAQNYWITGEFFSQAPQSLTEVFAEGCNNLTDKSVGLLAQRCPNLETIDISGYCQLTGQSVTALATNCPNLKRFRFSTSAAPPSVFQQFRQDLVELMRQLNASRRGNALRPQACGHFLTLSNLPLLEELNIDNHIAVTDEVFHQLGRHCPLLRFVSCIGCNWLTDASLAHLSPCLHLESVHFSCCTNITANGLIKFSSALYDSLKKVHLRGCWRITDKGVGQLLLAHPNLLELNISGCYNVTDGVLPLLISNFQRRQPLKMQPLKIWCNGTSIHPEKLRQLKAKYQCVQRDHQQ